VGKTDLIFDIINFSHSLSVSVENEPSFFSSAPEIFLENELFRNSPASFAVA
jgi:hypothetical protein